MNEPMRPKLIEVQLSALVEWEDNPETRTTANTERLLRSLNKDGLCMPLGTIDLGHGKYLVFDGNRRLRLMLADPPTGKIPILVYPKGTDPVSLALVLNTKGKPWNSQAQAQLVSKHPDHMQDLEPGVMGWVRNLHQLFGSRDFKKLVKDTNPAIYQHGKRVARYIGVEENETMLKKCILWLAQHKMTQTAEFAIRTHLNPDEITKAVNMCTPLKLTSMVTT